MGRSGNTEGEQWEEPILVNLSDVDCEARSGDALLQIQVTRAQHDPNFGSYKRQGRCRMSTRQQMLPRTLSSG
jgi:hypothetical protein